MAVDRTSPTEYAGGSGIIQTTEDGHTISPKEEALAMRVFGKRSDTGYYTIAEEDVGVYAGATSVFVDPEQDRNVQRLNGRTVEDLGVNP